MSSAVQIKWKDESHDREVHRCENGCECKRKYFDSKFFDGKFIIGQRAFVDENVYENVCKKESKEVRDQSHVY